MKTSTFEKFTHIILLTLKYTGIVLFCLLVPILCMLGSICKSAAKHGESMYGGKDL